MAEFGLTPEDYAADITEVWPDNLRAVNLFISVRKQWRVGPRGPYGLDFNVLYKKLDRMNLTPEEYSQLESDIDTMEDAALAVIHANSNK